MSVSFIVPCLHREEYLEVFCKNFEFLKRKIPAELIVVGNVERKFKTIDKLVVESGLFRRGFFMNLGFFVSSGDYVVFHDCDLLLHPILFPLKYRPEKCPVMNFSFLFDLGPASSKKVIASPVKYDFGFRFSGTSKKRFPPNENCGGSLTLSRDLVWQIGGWESRMRIWGAEDNELAARLRYIKKSPKALDMPAVHIYHESARKHPFYRDNRRILEECRANPGKAIDARRMMLKKEFVEFTSTFDETTFFVIFSCGRNCSRFVPKHVSSVVSQNYSNYIHICVDDASSDETALVLRRSKHSKMEVVVNKKRLFWWGNALKVLRGGSFPENAVIVVLDLDDWFENPYVLSYLNVIYQTSGCWVTYGQYKTTDGLKGGCKDWKDIVKNGKFRKLSSVGGLFSHLKTFRYWLFNKIRKEDVLDKSGGIIPYAYDIGLMLPLLEMSYPNKIVFIPETLMVYNKWEGNVQARDRKSQVYCENLYLKKAEYDSLVPR